MVKTKEVRNSRINPTAVTDEFKSEVGKICDILGVREPDLVRSAVESYVNSLYRNGEVIKFYDEFEKTNVGMYAVAGEYYENGKIMYEFTFMVMNEFNTRSVSYDVIFLDGKIPQNEEIVRKQIINKYERTY
jgi:hypothetical protein